MKDASWLFENDEDCVKGQFSSTYLMICFYGILQVLLLLGPFEKDIDYDWDCLGDFPHFLISLHYLLDSPLQTNNVIDQKICEKYQRKQRTVCQVQRHFHGDFDLPPETWHCIFSFQTALCICVHYNTNYMIIQITSPTECSLLAHF